ncbi:putative holin [Pandoraea sp.]|uniref:putative holin n=1 Tax=Pandoraea sp. TaxID=1883445 RepID=UPI0011FA64E9|nr:putative holin [Pandoraea sp.]TAL53377.1 MAG: hypothetical protein EPN80_15735 [Pandoraea sp.]TAM20467.1 MAG: hypothetical protein EPN65_00985 [Pandoraea sp.]
MSEPVSTLKAAALLAGSVGVASFWPSIDGNALIGAFAGAAVFVLHRREQLLVVRLLHFCASVAIGYLAAPELLDHLPVRESGVSAAIAAACAVTLIRALIDALDKCDLAALWNTVRGRRK